ncbi:glycosyltransferase family 4 protein [Sphingomonas lenta]|uniref:Glycosyltransferase subfamily 4-like N-terminal domain-containing protein n=1 Tax=Sphingomonas lenta TaxID=1141887 RepID=A0A2A2SAV7_9SPHN|nr:glycosyltransferase family 4 protein [Sphingomonas lenta]PAX06335.1 hypothetical protein CKY28_17810 [Sphingomonas lenta]
MTPLPIVFPFSSHDIGGSHVATYELAAALQAGHGRRCIFLCAAETPIAAEARRRGIEVVDTGEIAWAHASLKERRSPVRMLRRLPARLAIMRRIGRCIVHANEIVAIQSFGLLAKLLGGRIVYHHHALNRMVLPYRFLIGRADAVIAVSETCRAPLSFVSPERLRVVLNPIEVPEPFDCAAARARVCGKLGIDPAETLIGFVGNLWHRKRPEFFLRAAAAMRSEEGPKRFILFGRKGDVDVPEMEALASELRIADRVTFAGFMMPAEDNIAALDLLMAPAINEPFGRTPIEAALLGTPWIATDDAGHGEIGRRWPGGRLVAIDADEAAFAAAALEILENPGAVAATPAERARIAADFAPAREAAEVNAIYERLERGAA